MSGYVRAILDWLGPGNRLRNILQTKPISVFLHCPIHEERRSCNWSLVRLFHPYCTRDPFQKVVRKYTEHAISDECLHVDNNVRFEPSHEFVQVIVDCFGVQCANVVQVDVSQDNRGADEVQPVNE